MNFSKNFLTAVILTATGLLALSSRAQTNDYKILKTKDFAGTGRIDYVYADNYSRRLYIPRGGTVEVFDEDSLFSIGSITNTRAHGVAVDVVSHRGFSSSTPVAMWDSETLTPIKTIEVKGRPDGIMFEPFLEQIYVLSHEEPNVTVLKGKDGMILGTIDLGGAPEEAVSDGAGRVYVALEDKDAIAVVDAKSMKLLTTYSLAGKGGGPAGLSLDAKNGILFAFCHEPAVAVILSAKDGKVITTLPIGKGVDGGGFNPDTLEAFSSQGDGTLTIIKEFSPTHFEVSQTVKTMARAKTCTLDTRNNHIITATITLQPVAATNTTLLTTTNGTPSNVRPARGSRVGDGPGTLEIMTVGRPEMN